MHSPGSQSCRKRRCKSLSLLFCLCWSWCVRPAFLFLMTMCDRHCRCHGKWWCCPSPLPLHHWRQNRWFEAASSRPYWCRACWPFWQDGLVKIQSFVRLGRCWMIGANDPDQHSRWFWVPRHSIWAWREAHGVRCEIWRDEVQSCAFQRSIAARNVSRPHCI